MEQSTHAWIAVRALKLLQDEDTQSPLVALLKPHLAKATVGGWLPDQQDAKRGGSKTENHVLKIHPYEEALVGKDKYKPDQRKRFIADKAETLKRLGGFRMVSDFIDKDTANVLDSAWWGRPYRGDVPKPGMHVPNRTLSLSVTLADLLLLGDDRVDALLPGDVSFGKDLGQNARTTPAQAATFFFMLSHFAADATMPCHCDARAIMAYAQGLHMELEEHWKKGLPKTFTKVRLSDSDLGPDGILEASTEADATFNLQLGRQVPAPVDEDVWSEFMSVCRASFALAAVMVPEKDHSFTEKAPKKGKLASFKDLFPVEREALLKRVDQVVLHDAVINTAVVWKHAWGKASARE
jgi:hypothetical protein